MQPTPLLYNLPEPNTKAFDSIIHSNSRYNIWTGAVRSSKTISSLFRWLQAVYDAPVNEGKIVMIGKSTNALKRNILEPLQQIVGENRFSWQLGSKNEAVYLAGK